MDGPTNPGNEATAGTADLGGADYAKLSTSAPAGTPFDMEITSIEGLAGFRESLGRLAPEELAELIARIKSDHSHEHAKPPD